MKAAIAGAVAVLALLPAGAMAQQAEAGRFHLAATVGYTDYDMGVVGQSTVYSGRAGVRLNRLVGLETHLGYAAVEEFDGTSAIYTPEAQVQVRWPLRWASPFVGAGAGMIVADSYDAAIANDSEVTFSSAVGVTAALGSRVLMLGEVRARGVGTRFTGATGDLNVGVGYRF